MVIGPSVHCGQRRRIVPVNLFARNSRRPVTVHDRSSPVSRSRKSADVSGEEASGKKGRWSQEAGRGKRNWRAGMAIASEVDYRRYRRGPANIGVDDPLARRRVNNAARHHQTPFSSS